MRWPDVCKYAPRCCIVSDGVHLVANCHQNLPGNSGAVCGEWCRLLVINSIGSQLPTPRQATELGKLLVLLC